MLFLILSSIHLIHSLSCLNLIFTQLTLNSAVFASLAVNQKFLLHLQAKSENSNASSENSDQGAPNVEAVLYTSPNSASQAQVG